MSCNIGCAALPAYSNADICTVRRGGNSGLVLLECDHGITNWSTSTQLVAAIAAGKAVKIDNLVVEVPDPSPIEGDSVTGCGPAKQLDTFDRTITFMDYKISQANIDFYNAVNKRTFGGFVVYNCTEDEITVFDGVKGKPIVFRSVPKSEDDKQKFVGKLMWKQLAEGNIYDSPAGVFNT